MDEREIDDLVKMIDGKMDGGVSRLSVGFLANQKRILWRKNARMEREMPGIRGSGAKDTEAGIRTRAFDESPFAAYWK